MSSCETAVAENPNDNSVKKTLNQCAILQQHISKCDRNSGLKEKTFKWQHECYKETKANHDKEIIFWLIDKGYSPGKIKTYLNELFPDNI